MTHNRITINGQSYGSPDEMPPEVRGMYEDALRAAGQSFARGPKGGNTQVFTGPVGRHVKADMVVNKTIVVNNQSYGSLDELPPDVRQLYEAALRGEPTQGTPHTKLGFQVSVDLGRRERGPFGDSGKESTPPPLPIEPSTIESKLRSLPIDLAILVGIGLVIWAFLR